VTNVDHSDSTELSINAIALEWEYWAHNDDIWVENERGQIVPYKESAE
jgi:hypothetical protein